ncbi:MAG: Trk system potassium transporter TrkA, partial [Planctomycetales bacterium]|nr:Trk system potassium transporter TrkA [Planctomycetales bacterium]
MRIVTLGGGTVGESIAALLCAEGHSVIVVDEDPARTQRIYDELDVQVITGSASLSSVVFQAVGFGADICLAVTGVDEVNILAASMAKKMGVHRSIARVYGSVFHDLSTFDYQHHFGIDRLLSLEHLTANEFARNIRSPNSIVVEHFSRGHLEVKEVRVSEHFGKRGVELKDLQLPKSVRIGSIKREDRMWIATANDRLEVGDRVTLIGDTKTVEEVADNLERDRHKKQKQGVVIAGGGETGYHLARALDEDRFKVVILEDSEQRCEFLAKKLPNADVVHADATLRHRLEEERVGKADVFVACTGDD